MVSILRQMWFIYLLEWIELEIELWNGEKKRKFKDDDVVNF